MGTFCCDHNFDRSKPYGVQRVKNSMCCGIWNSHEFSYRTRAILFASWLSKGQILMHAFKEGIWGPIGHRIMFKREEGVMLERRRAHCRSRRFFRVNHESPPIFSSTRHVSIRDYLIVLIDSATRNCTIYLNFNMAEEHLDIFIWTLLAIVVAAFFILRFRQSRAIKNGGVGSLTAQQASFDSFCKLFVLSRF